MMWCLPASLRIRPEDFFSSRAGGCQRCFSESPLWLCCESLPVSFVEVRVGVSFLLWWRGMTRVGDGYGKVVRVDHITWGMPALRWGHLRCPLTSEMPAQKGDIWRGGLAQGGEVSREVMVRNSELWTVDRPIKRFPSGRCPFFSCSSRSASTARTSAVSKWALLNGEKREELWKSSLKGRPVRGRRVGPGRKVGGTVPVLGANGVKRMRCMTWVSDLGGLSSVVAMPFGRLLSGPTTMELQWNWNTQKAQNRSSVGVPWHSKCTFCLSTGS